LWFVVSFSKFGHFHLNSPLFCIERNPRITRLPKQKSRWTKYWSLIGKMIFCTCILALVFLVLHIEIYIKFNKIRGNSYIFYYLQLIVPKSKSVNRRPLIPISFSFGVPIWFGRGDTFDTPPRGYINHFLQGWQQSTGRPGATPEGKQGVTAKEIKTAEIEEDLGNLRPQGLQQRGGMPQGPPQR
jgi:hypothetical protein